MNARTIIISITAIAGIIAGVLFFSERNESQRDTIRNEQKIPDVVLQNAAGEETRLLNFLGTPLVINSWAVWCPFCKEELADFAEAQKEFGDAITIIAVNRAETIAKTEEFTDSIGITDDLVFLFDPSDSFYRAIGGFSMPETIFVDKNGIIKDNKRGPMKKEEIRRRIQQSFGL